MWNYRVFGGLGNVAEGRCLHKSCENLLIQMSLILTTRIILMFLVFHKALLSICYWTCFVIISCSRTVEMFKSPLSN